MNDVGQRAAGAAILVLALVDGKDEVGITTGIFLDDGAGSVGRGVVVDYGNVGERCLLHDNAIEAFAQEGLVVVDERIAGDFDAEVAAACGNDVNLRLNVGGYHRGPSADYFFVCHFSNCVLLYIFEISSVKIEVVVIYALFVSLKIE